MLHVSLKTTGWLCTCRSGLPHSTLTLRSAATIPLLPLTGHRRILRNIGLLLSGSKGMVAALR